MMTANEARTATNDRLNKIAKEFIWNVASKKIQEAIDNGYFFATVSTEGLPDTNAARIAVSKLLETDYGFVVDYTKGVTNGFHSGEGYFTIRWDVGDREEDSSKKYEYMVCLSAEDAVDGTVFLTPKEATVVSYATDPNNWKHKDGGGYHGSFFIDLANPKEVVGDCDED